MAKHIHLHMHDYGPGQNPASHKKGGGYRESPPPPTNSRTLAAHGWKRTGGERDPRGGGTVTWHEHPQHPGHIIGSHSFGLWEHHKPDRSIEEGEKGTLHSHLAQFHGG